MSSEYEVGQKISINTSVRVINQGDSQGTYFIVEPD